MPIYAAIDLKSFYASVECVERGLSPMRANLVVADQRRTNKTICLAVSPSLKSWGIPGRPRLFEVIKRVDDINARRRAAAPGHVLRGGSCDNDEILSDTSLALDYIVAPPRMALYIEYSVDIYRIYLRFVAPEDIIVYSIDEVFMDVTSYLAACKLSAHDFVRNIIREVQSRTGVTATAGIGTNLYLAKTALDIAAKHMPADSDGVRIAQLDEQSYRKQLWAHRPLTDFWRVGRGYAAKLEAHGMYTMGDVARCSVRNEDLLYELFGVNAELLIDHAWGWEPCTIADVKAYRPESRSLGSGQVLRTPYSFEDAGLVMREMAEALALQLFDKSLLTDKLTITVGYDVSNMSDAKHVYRGPVETDRYGRRLPKSAHGTVNLGQPTSSGSLIAGAAREWFDKHVDKRLLIRRLNITAERLAVETGAEISQTAEQLDLLTDYDAVEQSRAAEKERLERERRVQRAVVDIKKKFGNNAIHKASGLKEPSTVRERGDMIGGHKA